MAGVGEESRGRIAALLLGVGCLLIVLGFYFAIDQQREMAAVRPIPPGSVSEEKKEAARAIQLILLWALLLVGVFAVASFAFLRWSRHYRRRLLRKPSPPTPVDDVWGMHRLPDDDALPEGEPDSPE